MPSPASCPRLPKESKSSELGAEKRMENQFLTSGCYFSCQRFKAVAGAIKAEGEVVRERERGGPGIELGKIAINVDLKSLPAIIGNN